MPKPRSGRESGIHGATAMILRLELNEALAESCNPESDDSPEAGPMRNIVFEDLEKHMVDRASLEGFCLVLSSYVSIVAQGVVPEASWLRKEIKRREKRDRATA